VQGKGYGASSLKREVRCISLLLNDPPSLAIDVGGNVGGYTSELKTIFPDLNIHIFEPSKTNIEKLKTKFVNDCSIRIAPLGLSNSCGSRTLYSNESGSGLGSLSRRRLDHRNIPFNISEDINIIRFEDYWVNELKSSPIDIVKIDIEGHEFNALQGFGKALKFTKVIQFEFGGCNIDTRTFFQDFWYFFKANNFILYRITPFGLNRISAYKENDEYFSTTNFIAVNQHFIL
jgi:FkbM family methyltransferase